MAEAAEFPETPPAPARRWLRRAVTLLISLPLLAMLGHPAQAGGPGQPASVAATKATGSRMVNVSINAFAPTAPVAGDTLTISGTVTNNGSQPITDAHVGLRLGPVLAGRSSIDSRDARTSFLLGADGTEIDRDFAEQIDRLAPGLSRDFSLSVPVNKLNLGKAGVYPLSVTLSGQTSDQPSQLVRGIQRTYLPWQPGDTSGHKTELTYLWPLISGTQLTARTDTDEQQSPVFRNDDLAKELAPGGRLQQMVARGAKLPVTWVIDPDLLASVEAMTKGYQVEDDDHAHSDTDEDVATHDGKGQENAKRWLRDLQKAVGDKRVVALPFADPDLASLAHHGKNVSGALSNLKSATELASKTVETMFGSKPRTDFAWPVDGAVDPSIVKVATSAGARHIITRSDSLRETGGLTYTPSSVRPIGHGVTAVSADAELSTAFTGDMTRADNSTLAVQRFLAQSLILTLQTPSNQRSVVVAPQRTPSTSQAQAMAKGLEGLGSKRWTEPTSLDSAAKATPDPAANRRVPGQRAYPSSLRHRELPTKAFEDIQRTHRTLNSFKVILSARDRVATPFGNSIMRQMSTSWRGHRKPAAEYRDGVQDYLTSLTQQVHLIHKSNPTLSGRSGTIPVTVQNGLLQNVRGLKLVLQSSQPNRLSTSDAQPISVEGGHSQSVKFQTSAHANGRVWVTAQLYTEDGKPYGAPVNFEVNVTEITSAVILVIAGGVLLLVLAGIRIYIQRKRRTSAPAPHPDSDQEATESGQPSEADGSDTGSQSDGPSGSGEKVDR